MAIRIGKRPLSMRIFQNTNTAYRWGLALWISGTAGAAYKSASIISPIANLVSKPNVVYHRQAPVGPLEAPDLCSQLLYGEPIFILKSREDWHLIESPTTLILDKHTLKPLTGWVHDSHIGQRITTSDHNSCIELICTAPLIPLFKKTQEAPQQFEQLFTLLYGTRLQGIKKDGTWWQIKLLDGRIAYAPAPCVITRNDLPQATPQLRAQIVRHARQFIGSPYCWGGTSAYDPSRRDQLTGFDCSGLIRSLYGTCNLLIPRNSRAQFFLARPKEPAQLEAGDLLFLAYPAGSTRIVHVMLYTGKDTFIESWMERLPNNILNVQPIHEVSTRVRLGKPLRDIKQGELCGYYSCFGGTFLG